jgi:hypothetical protein
VYWRWMRMARQPLRSQEELAAAFPGVASARRLGIPGVAADA